MERHLVRQGRNALTVTLPAEWLKQKGLSAGDAISIDVKNHELIIRTEARSAISEIELNLKNQEQNMIWHQVLAKYIEGYDTIIVHHNDPTSLQSIGKELIGMVVEEHTQTKTILKNIVSIPEKNVDALIRRVGHMFLQQAAILEQFSRGVVPLEVFREHERLIDSTIYYCLRYFTKYEQSVHAYRYFLFCSTIELAVDELRRIAKEIGKNTALAKLIHGCVEEYVKYMFSKDIQKLYTSLRSFRDRIGKKTFVDGLAYSFAELLYNNLGYLTETPRQV
jgi:antitoxin component of MazEF toxin-antitoxin module